MIERNGGSMEDMISRKAAIGAVWNSIGSASAVKNIENLPSVQPETHDKRTKTHSCDCISRQAAMEEISKQQTYKMFEGEDTLYLDANDVGSVLASLPSAQPDSKELSSTHKALDTISRQAAIDAVENIDCSDGAGISALKCEAVDDGVTAIKALPSAQPERLTDDDFETIRIHLNAYKEKLCNQHRWEEANEYQRILDRFMAFASAQPELIRINLNEPIKVKLTDWGKEIYYHQYDRINQIAGREICKPMFPREDENGYTEFQLWCFIELYGMHMGMTLPNVIEPLEIVYER